MSSRCVVRPGRGFVGTDPGVRPSPRKRAELTSWSAATLSCGRFTDGDRTGQQRRRWSDRRPPRLFRRHGQRRDQDQRPSSPSTSGRPSSRGDAGALAAPARPARGAAPARRVQEVGPARAHRQRRLHRRRHPDPLGRRLCHLKGASLPVTELDFELGSSWIRPRCMP